jgi:hypothetical protein
MAWATVSAPGNMIEVHVIPLCDKRFHTVPICWCNPNQIGWPGNVFSHNALDTRIV